MEESKRRISDFKCKISPRIKRSELKPHEYEVYDAVERYKRQMITYMNRSEVELENAIPSATQELGHSYYLQKKRLSERGIRIHYAKFLRKRNAEDNSLLVKYDEIHAKNQIICTENQNTDYEIRYVRDGKLFGVKKKVGYLKHYVFRAKNVNGIYACPSCGATQPLEALLDGCDYCKEVFDINAYEDKVASVCDERATKYTGVETRKKAYKLTVPLSFLFGMLVCGGPALCVIFATVFSDTMHIVIKIFMIMAMATLGVAGVAVIMEILLHFLNKTNKAVKKYDSIYDTLRKYNPDFDMDEFVSLMDSKIKALYYASDSADVSAFAMGKLDSFLQMNRNVIACEVNRIELYNYRTDEKYQYVDVYREVQLTRDMGTGVAEENRHLNLTLCKKKNYKERKDVIMYRCTNCGSAVSLRTGGMCRHCGSKIDYMLYDWAIIGMDYVAKPDMVLRFDGMM